MDVARLTPSMCFFTSRSVRSVRTAGSKIALRFQYVTTYATMQLQYIAAFGGLQAELQQRKAVVCCLHGKNLEGSSKDTVFVASYY